MDMGSMVNGILRKTGEILETSDVKRAHRIQEGDVAINRFERHIEQTCLSLIKRESPIAGDLRLITAALKIITDLERAADQCADICEIIERSGTAPHLAPSELLLEMMAQAMQQFNDALGAYFDEDEALRRFEDDEIVIEVSLGTGGGADTRVWTCDLTHEYIHINADYRS